jgi:hypothetical protein
MFVIALRRSFGVVTTERARLHASLSRLWVMHHRLVRGIDSSAAQYDDRRRLSWHRHHGPCERCIVRLELRLSTLAARRQR